MNAQQEETVSILNRLIETCRDGQDGFRTASECIAEDPELKMLLSSFSLQRAKFAGDLEAQLIVMGEHEPPRDSSLKGAAHRGWINLKAAMTRSDNHAILAECERGEDVAMAEYNDALSTRLPEPVREMVMRQRQEVIATHNTVRALRDATPAGMSHVISEAKHRTRDARHEVAGSAVEVWNEMKYRAKDIRRSTETYVRKNPLPTMAAALLTGFAVGMLFYALELRNERARLEMESQPIRRLRSRMNELMQTAGERAASGYEASREALRGMTERMPRQMTTRRSQLLNSLQAGWDRMISAMR